MQSTKRRPLVYFLIPSGYEESSIKDILLRLSLLPPMCNFVIITRVLNLVLEMIIEHLLSPGVLLFLNMWNYERLHGLTPLITYFNWLLNLLSKLSMKHGRGGF